MVEESDRPGRGEPPEGSRREQGIFAERRALRAADSGDAALVRRAEAAEATVHTLERHVTSLQQRLDEAEQERQRLADLLEAERTVALERESELRRVKQREYAEQQLRVEAEDRLVGIDRESRADVSDLRERLAASERDAGELSARLQSLQRRLAEAEQAAAAERAAARSLDGELQARLAQLERRGGEMQARLDAERAARESSDRLIAAMRDGHRRMESLVEEVRGTVGRLGEAISAAQPAAAPPAPAPEPAAPPVPPPAPAGEPSGEEGRPGAREAAPRSPQPVGEDLAAALRRRTARPLVPGGAPVLPPASERPPRVSAGATTPTTPAHARAPMPPRAPAGERGEEMSQALAAAVERLRARAEAAPERSPEEDSVVAAEARAEAVAALSDDAPASPSAAPRDAGEEPSRGPGHKHAMSLIGRLRNRRKQRRSR